MADLISAFLLLVGVAFFLAGTLGLLRFPDVYSRLHALTKADNLGLGLLVAGLAIRSESWFAVGKLVLIWLLVLVASSFACHLVARAAWRRGIPPWT
jgi:multicomponent Na+:H+ antiporter subunit G